MGREPACPFCGAEISEPIPASLEGSINLRCPECESIFEFTPGLGSFPIEENLGIHISLGRLGTRVTIGSDTEFSDRPVDTLSRAFYCGCLVVIGMLIIALVLLAIFIG